MNLSSLSNALVITRRELRDSLRDWRIVTPIALLTLAMGLFGCRSLRDRLSGNEHSTETSNSSMASSSTDINGTPPNAGSNTGASGTGNMTNNTNNDMNTPATTESTTLNTSTTDISTAATTDR